MASNRFYSYDREAEVSDKLITQETINNGLRWWPDRLRIAFSTRANGGYRHTLRVVRLADKRVRSLATSRLEPHCAWSPDGKEIAYSDANCLMVVPSEGGEAREITCAAWSKLPQLGAFPGTLAHYVWWDLILPGWSPDGRMLAWTVPVPDKKRVELWVVDYATGRHQVAWAGQREYYSMPRRPMWSPDGKRIAITVSRYPDTGVWALKTSSYKQTHSC